MPTNQILAMSSLGLLFLCVLLALIVLIGKPPVKWIAILAGGSLFCMIGVTVLSIILVI